MQEGILFHALLQLDNEAYHEQWCCVLSGELDVAAFKHAWRRVIERHPVLRTAFNWHQRPEPFQIVYREVEPIWKYLDWRRVTVDEHGQQLDILLEADRAQGFDLAQAPLMRFYLIRQAERLHQFVWSHHHLLFDGWSLPILLKEVFQAYDVFCQNQDLHPPIPRPYRDYIAWLQRQDLSAAESFWRAELQGLVAPIHLNLARCHENASARENAYDERQLQLSAQVTAALRTLAQHHRLSLNTLVQGAWSILLSCYSGQEDALFGSTVAGRPSDLEGVESMVGLFINTLPVRVQVSSEAILLSWLQALQARQAEARQYEFSPLVQVQGWADVTSGQPLFESILVFENYPARDGRQAWTQNLDISNVRLVSRTNYPLTVVAIPGSELRLRISYQCQHFDAQTVARMLGHLQTLLEEMVSNPHQKLANLALLSQPERDQLLVEWNDTQVDYPHTCIHHLFEAQALRTPDAVAVVFEDEVLTYGQLNRRANRLAYILQALGVGPEVRVGICVERSFEMIVGLLGILKAGGAYVPLDPEYPAGRLTFMLSDTQSSVLVTQRKFTTMFEDHALHVIRIDTVELERGNAESETNPVSGVAPENLAYVMYTSGSTGTPKGVMVPHRALSNHMAWMQASFPLAATDRVLHKTSISFDASVWELFAPLSTGGQLILARPGGQRDSAYLVGLLAAHQVTMLKVVPSLLQMLLEEKALETCQSLRHVFCGGEVLSPALQEQFFSRLDASLHNLYGPTEATIDVTAFTCERGRDANVIPIGRPIANTQVYLLDTHLQPVPIGVPGELYIGGDSLARGYLNRPALTDRHFIVNPFDGSPGAHLYKTGDLGRYLADGNIEFLGRLDQQIKIRGYRIEPGEVAAVLEQHPSIQQSIVMAREDTPDNRRLVAYVVPAGESALNSHSLRRFLQSKLPEYMIPAAFVTLETLPLTPSGKVDRGALPVPGQGRPELDEAFVRPSTPIEELLAEIWATVLEIESIGIHDNFFALGGHSLLAMQVMVRLRNALQVEAPLRTLFDAPTVAELARCVETIQQLQRHMPSSPVRGVPRQESMAVTINQEPFWELDCLLPGAPFSNMPYAVRLTRPLNVAALEQSFNEIIKRHEVLRTTFASVEGRPVQIIAPTLHIPLKVEELRHLPQTEREVAARRRIRETALHPFDLTQGPLLHVDLLQTDRHEHILLIVMHHIISDGWSMGILMHELSVLYDAFSHGDPSPLPDLPIQYADFAHWQRRWLDSDAGKAQLAYWMRRLAAPLPILELPSDRPRTGELSLQTARQTFQLSKALSTALRRLNRQEGTTIFMTLVAAFKLLLYSYTEQEDIRVGTLVANRQQQETEGLIGPFVNLVILRTNLEGNPTGREVLNRVRNTTLDAYAHQGLPFEYLVRMLEHERQLDRQFLFPAMFAMQNARQHNLQLPGLSLEVLETQLIEISACDLAVSVCESQQGLEGLCIYKTSLFDTPTIIRLIEDFQRILAGLVAEPALRLSLFCM